MCWWCNMLVVEEPQPRETQILAYEDHQCGCELCDHPGSTSCFVDRGTGVCFCSAVPYFRFCWSPAVTKLTFCLFGVPPNIPETATPEDIRNLTLRNDGSLYGKLKHALETRDHGSFKEIFDSISDNELAALAVNRYELGKELQFPATCLPFDWSAEPCDLSPGDGAALVLCLPLLYCFSFFAVGPDKCGWNLDEPTLCWCCFCCAAWPSAIYKYTPYNPEQHHPRLPGGTTEHGTNDAASTVRYPSLLSELEDAASAQSFTRGTAVNNGIIINAMRLLRRPRADSFGREYPLKVKTVAGDVYTVMGWGAADDLHAAILAEHPELAPHYFDSTTDGTNQQHAPFGLYSNDKRCIWLDPAYHSSTRDDMLATQKSAEVCLLYNRNAGVRDNNGQADSPTALIAKSHSKVALFV